MHAAERLRQVFGAVISLTRRISGRSTRRHFRVSQREAGERILAGVALKAVFGMRHTMNIFITRENGL